MTTDVETVARPFNASVETLMQMRNGDGRIRDVLHYISEQKTGARYMKIRTELGISEDSLVSIMSVLEHDDLVYKRKEGGTNWYQLTDAGYARLREIESGVKIPPVEEDEEEEDEEEDPDELEPLSAETPVSPKPKGGAGGPCDHCGEPQRNGYAKRSHERVCKENPERPKKSRTDAYSEKVQDTVYDFILEGKTAREVSHKLGIPEPVLSKWIHEWLDDGLIVVSRHGHSNIYAEAGKKPKTKKAPRFGVTPRVTTRVTRTRESSRTRRTSFSRSPSSSSSPDYSLR